MDKTFHTVLYGPCEDLTGWHVGATITIDPYPVLYRKLYICARIFISDDVCLIKKIHYALLGFAHIEPGLHRILIIKPACIKNKICILLNGHTGCFCCCLCGILTKAAHKAALRCPFKIELI